MSQLSIRTDLSDEALCDDVQVLRWSVCEGKANRMAQKGELVPGKQGGALWDGQSSLRKEEQKISHFALMTRRRGLGIDSP